jgi:hypothetical protein
VAVGGSRVFNGRLVVRIWCIVVACSAMDSFISCTVDPFLE